MSVLKDDMTRAMARPQLPGAVTGQGTLVGWSADPSSRRHPIGFGRAAQPGAAAVDAVLFGDEGHLMTIASTGAGKGIGCVVPALLRHEGPMIVIDPKGENAAVTADCRREMGQAVYIIDPMDLVPGPTARFNPLDLIDPASPTAADEAAALADTMSLHLGQSADNGYWRSRGQAMLTAVILHVVSQKPEGHRNLAEVRRMLLSASSGENTNGFAKKLSHSPHPEARAFAASLDNAANETIGSIISFAQDLVGFARGEAVKAATAVSDFAIEDVTSGAPLTIYIVVPPHMLESHAPLLRLWIGALFSAITRRRTRPPKPTMLILDEAAQLGGLPQLRQAITLLRGYGLQTWSFWQDVEQLKHSYPTSWRTLVNNCQVVQAFGAPNMHAAADISDLFHLPDPQRVLDLNTDEMLVQMAGRDVFVARRPNYLADPAFAGRYAPNPFYAAVAPPKVTPVQRKEPVKLRESLPTERTEAEIIDYLQNRYT